MNNYYVYFLIDPRNNEVFYIGKGKKNRINNHFKELEKYEKYNKEETNEKIIKFSNHAKLDIMQSIIEDGKEIIVEKVIENLSEESAFVLEEILVDRFGQKIDRKGHLTNLLRGGNVDYFDTESNPIRTSMKVVRTDYPELLEVLKKYPNLNKTKYKKEQQIERQRQLDEKIHSLKTRNFLKEKKESSFTPTVTFNLNDNLKKILKKVEDELKTTNDKDMIRILNNRKELILKELNKT
ncbi:MAG: hypothetical protein A3K10_15680 [Bacteroidetes bacterium RIFCSPLOWO2_12_FULL_31_6]|nr:MAG: hypothetical protein A3K10_15680 [Bacteroidetes bacterium RIFCSPLOWO2_12_FULL_31_6]